MGFERFREYCVFLASLQMVSIFLINLFISSNIFGPDFSSSNYFLFGTNFVAMSLEITLTISASNLSDFQVFHGFVRQLVVLILIDFSELCVSACSSVGASIGNIIASSITLSVKFCVLPYFLGSTLVLDNTYNISLASAGNRK